MGQLINSAGSNWFASISGSLIQQIRGKMSWGESYYFLKVNKRCKQVLVDYMGRKIKNKMTE